MTTKLKCDCGRPIHRTDLPNSLITYWGEDGPQIHYCPECDRELTIREHVIRTWEIVPAQGAKNG